jgi:quercetin dioxygenase-like cupin family protein
MSYFDRIHDLAPYDIVKGLRARAWHGERLTLAVVDIEPNATLPEHAHENEQLGVVITGIIHFTIGGETKALGPGETWSIPSGTPHTASAGPNGCTVIDVFSPIRADWEELPRHAVSTPAWP